MGTKNGRASYNVLDLPDESEVPTSMNEYLPILHCGTSLCKVSSHHSLKKICPVSPVEVSDMTGKSSSTRARIVWSVLYVLTLLAVTGGMFEGRRQALKLYGTDEAQAEWIDG
jgi:hypothetical protein